jgi:nucleoside-diphosphate-sugar epimerase
MRALVAGGAGFLGSHLCEALVLRGHHVFCLDDFSTGDPANVAHLVGSGGVEPVAAHVEEAPDLEADLVVHMASPASPVRYRARPIATLLANSAGTHRLLELARRRRARFVLASTSEIYGDPCQHPQAEDYFGNVNPVGPRACYDEGKRFAEAMTMEYWRTHRVDASIVRIFNTYGPRMATDDGRAVPAFISSALRGEPLVIHGDGTQTRSFCYVSDLIDGILRVAFDRDGGGRVLNIGNPREIAVRDLAEAVVWATGSGSRIRFTDRTADDPQRRRPDISRMRARYGWEPTVALEEGLRRTISWFQNCGAALPERAGPARARPTATAEPAEGPR